eukprot:1316270-Amorphochlora_amoeboformis.AAC.1
MAFNPQAPSPATPAYLIVIILISAINIPRYIRGTTRLTARFDENKGRGRRFWHQKGRGAGRGRDRGGRERKGDGGEGNTKGGKVWRPKVMTRQQGPRHIGEFWRERVAGGEEEGEIEDKKDAIEKAMRTERR